MDCGPSPDHHLQKRRLARRATPIQEGVMTIADKAVLVTGADRGIGHALVAEGLRRGAPGSSRERDPGWRGAGEEDLFPDPMSQTMAEGWRSGAAKALERQNAALGAAPAAA
jgi:NAD(P)-dependent dehydrogenase (short-subunit alcohol dehydrogenase family)